MKLDIKQEGRVKCDCGHYLKDHYGRGACKKCGCTWWWWNVKYIAKKIHENNLKRNKKSSLKSILEKLKKGIK
jgi:hypothetical protein